MKSKLWNGSFLRTVLQGLAITCVSLLILSALGAVLVMQGVLDPNHLSAAAVCICALAVFAGALPAAKHAAGKKLPAALLVAALCFGICLAARMLFFGNAQWSALAQSISMAAAAATAGILGSRRPQRNRRRRR